MPSKTWNSLSFVVTANGLTKPLIQTFSYPPFFLSSPFPLSLSFSLSLCFAQIPRYIITLHELLAHTPHEHVERKSLEFAKSKLEELSK